MYKKEKEEVKLIYPIFISFFFKYQYILYALLLLLSLLVKIFYGCVVVEEKLPTSILLQYLV